MLSGKYEIVNKTTSNFLSLQTFILAAQQFLNATLYDYGSMSEALNCSLMKQNYEYAKVGWCSYVYPSLSIDMLMILLALLFSIAMSFAGVATAYRYSKIDKPIEEQKVLNEEDPINS